LWVKFSPADGVFSAYSGSGAVGAVCVNDIAVTASANNAAICRGEFEKEGMVALNAALAVPVTIDDAIIAECFAAGIILN